MILGIDIPQMMKQQFVVPTIQIPLSFGHEGSSSSANVAFFELFLAAQDQMILTTTQQEWNALNQNCSLQTFN